MVAYANEEALRATLRTGEAHFWSRSRRELWHKGGTSGNVQRVVSARLDCDHDTVLLVRRARRPGLPHRRGELLPRRGQRRRGDGARRRRRVSAGSAGRRRRRRPRRRPPRRHPRPRPGAAPQGHRLGPAVQLRQRRREHGGAQGLRRRARPPEPAVLLLSVVLLLPGGRAVRAGGAGVVAARATGTCWRRPRSSSTRDRTSCSAACSRWPWGRPPCTSCTGSAGSPSAARPASSRRCSWRWRRSTWPTRTWPSPT